MDRVTAYRTDSGQLTYFCPQSNGIQRAGYTLWKQLYNNRNDDYASGIRIGGTGDFGYFA